MLRWGARDSVRSDEQEAAELRSAITLISRANLITNNFTDFRISKATNLQIGKPEQVRCTTVSAGRKFVTSCVQR